VTYHFKSVVRASTPTPHVDPMSTLSSCTQFSVGARMRVYLHMQKVHGEDTVLAARLFDRTHVKGESMYPPVQIQYLFEQQTKLAWKSHAVAL
jgi:hypothetical protein